LRPNFLAWNILATLMPSTKPTANFLATKS
jgi:hypothetical protein